ncbi:MAG: flagellar biosynthesis anti-sigma factor FlgM [Acidobacteria bacterium]|nr:flagellar biosynthesis anti-sigma factor FlgM [Acidobacteriota bacterium]
MREDSLEETMEVNVKQPLVNLESAVHRMDTHQKAVPRAAEAGSEDPGFGPDRVELSVRGLQYQHLEELLHATPEIREAKVEQIRNAIQSGTYNVRGEQIAENIISGSLIDEVF